MTTKRKSTPPKAKKPAIEPSSKMGLLIDVIIDLDTRLAELKRQVEWDCEITDENAAGLLGRVEEQAARIEELEREVARLAEKPEVKTLYNHPSFGTPPWTNCDKSVPYWYAMPPTTYTHD